MRPCFRDAHRLLDHLANSYDYDAHMVDRLREVACDLKAAERDCLQTLAQDPINLLASQQDARLDLDRARTLLRNVQARTRVVERTLISNRTRRTA